MFALYPDTPVGPVRALHGVNLGPLDRFSANDYTPYFRKARIPSVRTHDTNRTAMEVVDLHNLFPNPEADPENPANYDFMLTDDYLQVIRNAGCEIYFRLGESIEGRIPRKKYIVGDRWKPEVLARVCVNIARHYTEGWADGFQWKISYWQFWNEPSNNWVRPAEARPCWTGTVEAFYALYRAVSTAMKAHNPAWKIGLAGYGRPDFVFPPGHPQYREDNPWRHIKDVVSAGPMDSISWHQYGASWEDLVSSAAMVRESLDAHGLSHVENHLTEWNYMPRVEDENGAYQWFDARKNRDVDRLDHLYEVMTGVKGAAYVFGGLARLQEAPLDLAHLYTGVCSGSLGLFNQHGRPHPKYAALETFATFLDQTRVKLEGGAPNTVAGIATRSGDHLRIGIAHLDTPQTSIAIRVVENTPRVYTARSFLAGGWRGTPVTLCNEEGAQVVTFPVAGDGFTILQG